MGPVEVSPQCLVRASNTVFSTSRQRGKKEENGLVSSEPSLSRRKQHSAQDDTRSKVKNKSSRLRWLSHLAGSSWATCKKCFVSRHSEWSGFKLQRRTTHWPAALWGPRYQRGQVWFSSTAVVTRFDVLYKNLGHGLNVVTIPADQQQFAKHSDLQPGR